MTKIQTYLKAYEDWQKSQPQVTVKGTRNGFSCKVKFYVNHVGGISLECERDHPSSVRYPDEAHNKDVKDVLTTKAYVDIGQFPIIVFAPEKAQKIHDWYEEITTEA